MDSFHPTPMKMIIERPERCSFRSAGAHTRPRMHLPGFPAGWRKKEEREVSVSEEMALALEDVFDMGDPWRSISLNQQKLGGLYHLL